MKEIKQINLADIIGNYVELKKAGSRLVACCPFHQEKTPSFFVSGHRFHCFGCGAKGDASDFIQKYHGCDFKESLKHLGIKPGYVSKEEIQRRQYERKLIKRFQKWLVRADAALSSAIRNIQDIFRYCVKDPEDLEQFSYLLHIKTKYEYWIDIIRNGDDKSKYNLYKEKAWIAKSCRYQQIFHSYKTWLPMMLSDEFQNGLTLHMGNSQPETLTTT
jgi:hypothetical protein